MSGCEHTGGDRPLTEEAEQSVVLQALVTLWPFFGIRGESMANIANALREEITRISRRENKKHTAVLQRASAQFRRDIAALKREVARLTRELKYSQRSARAVAPPTAEATPRSHRFVAKGFRTLRHRLGLSASQMGKLLNVSEQSIYNWETKVATPRAAHLPAIARLRPLGKREVAVLLEQSAGKK
jgi:DNA-binding transcriptional regulator YiaG